MEASESSSSESDGSAAEAAAAAAAAKAQPKASASAKRSVAKKASSAAPAATQQTQTQNLVSIRLSCCSNSCQPQQDLLRSTAVGATISSAAAMGAVATAAAASLNDFSSLSSPLSQRSCSLRISRWPRRVCKRRSRQPLLWPPRPLLGLRVRYQFHVRLFPCYHSSFDSPHRSSCCCRYPLMQMQLMSQSARASQERADAFRAQEQARRDQDAAFARGQAQMYGSMFGLPLL